MNCPKCKNAMYVDSVIKNGDTTKYVYVCVNPKCEDYKKAHTLDGEDKKTKIQEKKKDKTE